MSVDGTPLVLWSNTPGDVPTPADLAVNGRIAINQSDGKIFYLNRRLNVVQEVGYNFISNVVVPTVDGIGDAGTFGKTVLRAGTKYPAGDGSSITNLPTSTIADGSITLAKLAAINAMSLLGNNTGASGTPAQLSATQVKNLLAIAFGDVSGLGSAATLNAGTAVNNLVQLVTGGKLPALDGSNLTNLPSSGGGKLVDRTYSEFTNTVTLSTGIPVDSTVPQSNEGTQIISASITPKSTTNRVRATFTGLFTPVGGAAQLAVAGFIGAAASAVVSDVVTVGNGDPAKLSFIYEFVPGATVAIPFVVRVGASTASNASCALYQGLALPKAVLTLEEIAP